MLMQLNAAFTFFLITFCLGYATLKLSKARTSDHPLVYALEMLAIGLAAFSFLGVVLGLLHIPLHLYVYLGIAVALDLLAYFLDRTPQPFAQGWWKDRTTFAILGLIIILGLSFMMFHKGAFGYPYLEDDDPWNHALSVSYIAREHTYDIDPYVRTVSSGYAFYLEPYPPTFDVILGVMRQTNDSLMWTLKFFNALLVTLALATWYLFARAYLKSDWKALFSTAVLAALPSFMSHFIWSQTIALVVFPAALYAVLKAKEDKTWLVPAIVAVASMMVTQPVVSFLFGIVVILAALATFAHETTGKGAWTQRYAQTLHVIIAGAGGLALSFVFWGAQLAKWGITGFLQLRGGELPGSGAGWSSGYALQAYSLGELLFPPHASRMDQATGWGLAVTLALLLAFVLIALSWRKTLTPSKGWMHLHLLAWFLLLAYMVFAPSLGLPGYGSSRIWPELAMPLALLATEGTFILAASVSKQELARLGVAAGVLALILLTSLPAKVAVQTSQWPPGVQWTPIQAPNGGVSYPDLEGHAMMGNYIPKNSRVFAFCGGDSRVVGFDMQAEPWNRDQAEFRKRLFNATGEEIMAFLKTHQFMYITLDATCVREYGENATTALANRLTETKGFVQVPAAVRPGFLLAQVI